MTIALNNPVDRERRDVGIEIFNQLETGFCGSDFRDGGSHRTLQPRTARDGSGDLAPACGDHVDQISIDEKR